MEVTRARTMKELMTGASEAMSALMICFSRRKRRKRRTTRNTRSRPASATRRASAEGLGVRVGWVGDEGRDA
eukprot:2871455-Rhodomonas_salina.1